MEAGRGSKRGVGAHPWPARGPPGACAPRPGLLVARRPPPAVGLDPGRLEQPRLSHLRAWREEGGKVKKNPWEAAVRCGE